MNQELILEFQKLINHTENELSVNLVQDLNLNC